MNRIAERYIPLGGSISSETSWLAVQDGRPREHSRAMENTRRTPSTRFRETTAFGPMGGIQGITFRKAGSTHSCGTERASMHSGIGSCPLATKVDDAIVWRIAKSEQPDPTANRRSLYRREGLPSVLPPQTCASPAGPPAWATAISRRRVTRGSMLPSSNSSFMGIIQSFLATASWG